MFKTLNGFLGLIILIIVLKWALPEETVSLANEILFKLLSLIRDLLAQANL